MGMGKGGHKSRRREQEAAEASQSNILQLDPETRTHMLFPARQADETGPQASPSFMKMLTSGDLFRSKGAGPPFGGNLSIPASELQKIRGTSEEDPFFTTGKQVTFLDNERYPPPGQQLSTIDRRPNSYHCEKPARGVPEKAPFTSLSEPYRYIVIVIQASINTQSL